MRLRIAFSWNPRLDPLLDHSVQVEGVDELDWTLGTPGNLHREHLTDNAFDVFEFSISNFLLTREQPTQRERLHWCAIPVFLTKALMWLRLMINVNSGIKTLADLRGKRVGVPDYHMTAALWMRIVMKQLYNINPEDIRWFNGRTTATTHGAGVADDLKPGITLNRLDDRQTLNEMLHNGEIDAAYGAEGRTGLETGSNVLPLFSGETAAQVIADFRRVTGTTPTNHLVIVQQALLDKYPDLAHRLFVAFEQSKQEAYKRARAASAGYFLFPNNVFDREAGLYGEDPYPGGVEPNRRMLELLSGQSYSEGVLHQPVNISELFHPSLWTT